MGYSQLPVVLGKTVIGLFSHRSFAQKAEALFSLGKDPYAAEVFDLVEDPEYITADDDLDELIQRLQRDDSVLVGGKNRLQAVLTASNAMAYLYQLANVFFLLEEIELSLRHLMSVATDGDCLTRCIVEALVKSGRDQIKGAPPSQLEDLTLGQYVQVLEHGPNWPLFMNVLGKNREIALTHLRPIPGLRNAVFHFKRSLSIPEHETLANCRNWLHRRYSVVRAREAGDAE